MKRISIIILMLCVSTLILFAGGEQDTSKTEQVKQKQIETTDTNDVAEYVIRVAYQDPPDPLGSVNSAFMSVFKMKVEEFTGGKVEVKLYASGQLGNDLDNYMRVKAGELEMSGAGSGSLANALYPSLGIFDLPFLFPDNKIAFDVLSIDNLFVQSLNEGLKKETGVGVIAFIPQSFRNLTNNVRRIQKPTELKGLKIRTMQVKPHMAMISAAGAQSVPIAYTELYTSLQTGVVDGQENPLSNIRAMSFFEVQKYLTLSKHALNVSSPIYNVTWFNKLPSDIQASIMKAASAARTASVGMAFISDLINVEYFKNAGMNVYTPTPDEMAEFRSVMQPDALDWFKDNVSGGADLLIKLQDEIQKAERRY